MLSLNSRGRNRSRAGIHSPANALTAFTAGVIVCLGAVGIFAPHVSAAQTNPETQVSFTYLKDTEGIGGVVDTIQSQFVRPGLAFVSVTASFTGRGYGFGGPSLGQSNIGPGGGEARIEDGDAFIVTPIIDPDLNVNYVLHNETGASLNSLTFTLQPASDLYFFNTRTTSGGVLKQFDFGNSAGFFGDGTANGLREGFRSLKFSGITVDDFIASNDFNAFNFSLHIPDGQPNQTFAAVLSPGNSTPLLSPSTPEPGTLMLLLPVGAMFGAATKGKRRKRAS